MVDRRMLARRFESQRPRLVAIATQLLGSAADAEDVVQEAWLRLERSDTGTIENIDAWLTTVVSRLSLDTLRSPRRHRERSWQVTPWDEPVATVGDPDAAAARSDQVSVALLVVLELLTPAERLAFVLHDVFGLPFDEVAAIVGRSEPAVRQLASRARRRVRDAKTPVRPTRDVERSIVHAWLAAVEEGDFEALLELLDEGAVLRADYGAHSEEVRGAREIARKATLAARLAAHSTPVFIDGIPGVAAVIGGRVVSLMTFEVQAGAIIGLDVLADPARLERLGIAERLGLDG